MTDVARMSVAEPVGKVLTDRVGSGHPWPSAIAASLSSIVGQTDDHEACGVRTPTRLDQPALLHHIHDSTTTQGRARFPDPSRRGKMRHWGQESRGWGAWILDARIR
jgi:hypothetical protein